MNLDPRRWPPRAHHAALLGAGCSLFLCGLYCCRGGACPWVLGGMLAVVIGVSLYLARITGG